MLFKILSVVAAATTGIFAGLWWTERDHNEYLEMKLNVLRKVHQRALDKMTAEQLYALLGDTLDDYKFEQIVRDQ